MRYAILQLPSAHEAKYLHYDWAVREGCVPNKNDYVLVYVGQTWGIGNNLEDEMENIFGKLNSDTRPYDYKVFSPSVSDVIGVEIGKDAWEFYYIDGIGFKKIWDALNV